MSNNISGYKYLATQTLAYATTSLKEKSIVMSLEIFLIHFHRLGSNLVLKMTI